MRARPMRAEGFIAGTLDAKFANPIGSVNSLDGALKCSVLEPAIGCTNLPFSEWTQVIPNARLCKALIDRTTDRANIIETGTEFYRFAVRWKSATAKVRMRRVETRRPTRREKSIDLRRRGDQKTYRVGQI